MKDFYIWLPNHSSSLSLFLNTWLTYESHSKTCFKPSCHIPFTHAVSALPCVLLILTSVWTNVIFREMRKNTRFYTRLGNQGMFFHPALQKSNHIMKSDVATVQLLTLCSSPFSFFVFLFSFFCLLFSSLSLLVPPIQQQQQQQLT
jgi:hypothetical protein